MGQIRNWKKVRHTATVDEWKGADGDMVLVARPKDSNINGKWMVGANGMLHVKKCNTRKQAIAFATDYMKSYPEG